MLKRFIAAAILFGVCIAVCVSSYFVVKNLCEEITLDLNAALEYVERGEMQKADEAIVSGEKKWDKYKTVFDIFLDHTMLENINIDLPSIRPLIESGSVEPAKEKIEDSINALKGILDEQKISIGNIL